MIKFSNNYRAREARIKKIPEIYPNLMSAILKKDAVDFVRIYQKGLKTNNLANKNLMQKTIDIKNQMNLTRPDMPLYGKGEEEQNSLYNAHYIKKTKNGWKVKVKTARHHEKTNWSKSPANMSIKKLVSLHETGFTINVTEKMRYFLGLTFGFWLKPTTATVKVPARPARRKAYEILLQKRKSNKRETSRIVKKAISEFLKGNRTEINKLESDQDKELENGY